MANLDEKQIEGLQRILSLLDPDTLTKEEFKKQFKLVIDFVTKMKDKNSKSMQEFSALVKKVEAKLNGDNANNLAGIKAEFTKQLANLSNKHNEVVARLDKRISEITNGENGMDADEDIMIERLRNELPQMEDLKNDMPLMGEQIRDALELLQDEERLDQSAIKGLEEKFKELEEIIASRPLGGGGGGLSHLALKQHFLTEVELTGTKNGVNKVFTIAKTPNPENSLKVFRNGQRLRITAGDYTYSNKTITFDTAPASDEDIYSDYMV